MPLAKKKAKDRRKEQRGNTALQKLKKVKRDGLPERPAIGGVHPMGRRRYLK